MFCLIPLACPVTSRTPESRRKHLLSVSESVNAEGNHIACGICLRTIWELVAGIDRASENGADARTACRIFLVR